MPKTRLPYPNEFRDKIIELARNGRSVVELASEFEPSEQTIRNWIQQAELVSGKLSDGLNTQEKQELSRLRKENRRLQQYKFLTLLRGCIIPQRRHSSIGYLSPSQYVSQYKLNTINPSQKLSNKTGQVQSTGINPAVF